MIKTYRIGDIAKITGIKVETIRYYDSIGLLPHTVRSSNGYRLYNAEQLNLIRFIQRCRLFDISIAEIKQLTQLIHMPESSCTNVNEIVESHLQRIAVHMQALQTLQDNLLSLRSKCKQQVLIKECGILHELLQDQEPI